MIIALAFIHFVIGGLLIVFVNGGLKPWRRSVNTHWTERARLLDPIRDTAQFYRFLLPILLPMIWFSHDHSNLQYSLDALSTYLGAVIGCLPYSREIWPKTTFKQWVCSTICPALFNLYFYGGILVCITLMPQVPGWGWLVVVCVFFILHNPLPVEIMHFYFLRIGYLKPPCERLQKLAEDAATTTGITPSTVGQVTWPYIWVTAEGSPPELIVSDQALAVCSDEEILALCIDELAKIPGNKSFWDNKIVRRFSVFPALFIIPVNHHWSGLGFWLILPFFIIAWLSNRHSNPLNRTLQADKIAASSPAAGQAFARALEKLHRDNLKPAVSGKDLRLDLYQRMLTAGVVPDFPAPAAPSRNFTPVGKFTLFGLIVLIICIATGYPKIEVHNGDNATSITNQITNTN